MILEKTIWTTQDYTENLWHDNKVHAISFNEEANEILFDIDHIVEWIPKGKHFRFWISPCTLVFENVQNIEMDFEDPGLIIINVLRDAIIPTTKFGGNQYEWDIVGTSGEIWFRSTGFTQYARKQPVLVSAQSLSNDARGGISFARPKAGEVFG